MRSVLLSLFILTSFTACFSQSISDAEISDAIKSFWTSDLPDTIKPNPTFRKFDIENKEVVFFGTQHKITDASDPMYSQIEREINNLNPTIILTEGYGLLFDNKTETIRKLGDIGICTYAGYERGVRVKSWDMSYNDLYYSLRKEFSENELYTLMIIEEQARRADSADSSFSDFIADREARGWPFTAEQKSYAFFLKQYKRYFNIPLKITAANSVQIPEQVGKTPLLKKFYSFFQRLRDEHLIKMLNENLKLHDRIFIQAGAMHLMSLEKIIPAVLRGNKEKNLSEKEDGISLVNSLPDINFLKSFSIEEISHDDKKFILFGSNCNVDASDPQFAALKKEINTIKPNLVLTQGFDALYVSEKQTISESGVVGFCRFLGISNDIRVNSWEPSWNDVVYILSKKYKTEDIYFSLLCRGVLRNNNIKDVNSIEDLAIKNLTAFVATGYPLKVKVNDEFYFLKTVTEYLGNPIVATFDTPVPALSNPEGGKIELNNDGSYKFSGIKPGAYDYKIPLSISGVNDNAMVPLRLIIPDSMKNAFVEISGELPNPHEYISIEKVKEILQKCINLNIINDLHLIRRAHLLKQVKEYKKHYNRIFIQADREYINIIKVDLANI